MHATTIVSVVLTTLLASVRAQNITTGELGNATVVDNNPPGATYLAVLPEKQFFNPSDPRGNVKGSVSATASPDGIGVVYSVSLSNFPTSGGPFTYHLHVDPVPADGNCTKTLAHLDPFIRGEVVACDPKLPQTCQVGDLSGKYGKVTNGSLVQTYTDLFSSTRPGLGSFFGNRSITFHFANKTRITCANFTLLGSATIPPSTGSNTSATATPTVVFAGLGARNMASAGMALGAAALALLL
ncbi:Cu,Zn superoxide dismutase-like protein [Glarea lozoyensis ATCC 20868]|uniref:superoxide dismutase n=2 Tax=Glarea lozoyensis TaxID=101852 RepID=S3DRV7_GLAL2|nr:Cu,Zn superoxide dismutase-like protein [Glarea lozoyensis ATCC 20868]EHL03381.1 hypothetical protein M7I_0602 [Glarea lozoyensis 74030]EPE29183.1 Cu,Zn superoxide dismutase-like protein [Glarea lozoyensis ATCC 20868]